MRATVLYGAGDVRVENVPDARLIEPTDALVTVRRACICGSDLWPYKLMEPVEAGRRMGHEAIGVVEAVGADVHTVEAGDVVVMPFTYSDGTCAFCHEGLHTSCIHGGFFGTVDVAGAQAEAVRIPLADGTLFVLPVGEDDALMASLLTLSDVMGTGHHAALAARVGRGKTAAVVGDGAVGLCGVIAARRLPPRSRRSTATSQSVAAPPRSARTSRNCFRTSWRGGSNRAASWTGSSAWTRFPTATGR